MGKNRKISIKILKILVILILFTLGFYNQETIVETVNKMPIKLSEKQNFTFEENKIKYNLEEDLNLDLKIEFCPSIDCMNLFSNSFQNAQYEIKCAFYEFDEPNLSFLLKNISSNVNISLIIDDKYLGEENLMPLYNTSINIYSDIKRGTRYNNYMHNKFCIIDDSIIIAGSTNPTENGLFKNNNNLIKFESSYMAINFENEFDQMAAGFYGTNKKSTLEYNNLTLNFKNDSYLISSYFCPQDNCDEILLKYINNSKKEILFATFALTLDPLKDSLIKQSLTGIKVNGVIEKRNINLKGSDIKELLDYIEIGNDSNKNNMHHKFFIIDKNIVITGSMNPSGSGTKYNDEHLLVIKSKKVANLYVSEFNSLFKN